MGNLSMNHETQMIPLAYNVNKGTKLKNSKSDAIQMYV